MLTLVTTVDDNSIMKERMIKAQAFSNGNHLYFQSHAPFPRVLLISAFSIDPIFSKPNFIVIKKTMEPDIKTFTHLNPASGNPAMVDVGDKQVTKRIATAQSIVVLGEEIMQHFTGSDIQTKKGPVFQTAIIAGTMAAKKTADLIPLCHPLPLENCKVDININEQDEVVVNCTVSITSKTGVEMEALTGASVAALTIYDMCKAFSHDIVIKETRLIEKTGGKSDFRRNK
jgi:cyclic pyranopterin phosphate synthase